MGKKTSAGERYARQLFFVYACCQQAGLDAVAHGCSGRYVEFFDEGG
jgi:hypothetical protein